MTAALPKDDSIPPGPHERVKVYVSGPYTVGDACVNTHAAIRAANRLLDHGFIPFCPHINHFWHTMTPRPYEDWMAIDLAFLPACDVLLRLPGPSKGADIEVAAAKRHGLPVFESLDDLIAQLEPHKRTVTSEHPRNLHCIK